MIKQLLLAAALAGISSLPMAAEPAAGLFSAPGTFYAGVDVGATKLPHINSGELSKSYGAFGGYTLTPNFTVEASFRKLYDWSGWADAHEHKNQEALSLLGSVSVASGVSLYGRLGVNRLSGRGEYWSAALDSLQKHSYEDRTTHGLFGLGASYQLTEKVSARAEVQMPAKAKGAGPHLANFSAGVSYAF